MERFAVTPAVAWEIPSVSSPPATMAASPACRKKPRRPGPRVRQQIVKDRLDPMNFILNIAHYPAARAASRQLLAHHLYHPCDTR